MDIFRDEMSPSLNVQEHRGLSIRLSTINVPEKQIAKKIKGKSSFSNTFS